MAVVKLIHIPTGSVLAVVNDINHVEYDKEYGTVELMNNDNKVVVEYHQSQPILQIHGVEEK